MDRAWKDVFYGECIARGWAPKRPRWDFVQRPESTSNPFSHTISNGSLGGVLDVPHSAVRDFHACLADRLACPNEPRPPINECITKEFAAYFDLDFEYDPEDEGDLLSDKMVHLYCLVLALCVRLFFQTDVSYSTITLPVGDGDGTCPTLDSVVDNDDRDFSYIMLRSSGTTNLTSGRKKQGIHAVFPYIVVNRVMMHWIRCAAVDMLCRMFRYSDIEALVYCDWSKIVDAAVYNTGLRLPYCSKSVTCPACHGSRISSKVRPGRPIGSSSSAEEVPGDSILARFEMAEGVPLPANNERGKRDHAIKSVCITCVGVGSLQGQHWYQPWNACQGNGQPNGDLRRAIFGTTSVHIAAILRLCSIRRPPETPTTPGFSIPIGAPKPDPTTLAFVPKMPRVKVPGGKSRRIPANATLVPPGCARYAEVQRFLHVGFARQHPHYRQCIVDTLYVQESKNKRMTYVALVSGVGSNYCCNLGALHCSAEASFKISCEGMVQRCSCKCDTLVGRQYGKTCKEFETPLVPLPPSLKVILFSYSHMADTGIDKQVLKNALENIDARSERKGLDFESRAKLRYFAAALKAMAADTARHKGAVSKGWRHYIAQKSTLSFASGHILASADTPTTYLDDDDFGLDPEVDDFGEESVQTTADLTRTQHPPRDDSGSSGSSSDEMDYRLQVSRVQPLHANVQGVVAFQGYRYVDNPATTVPARDPASTAEVPAKKRSRGVSAKKPRTKSRKPAKSNHPSSDPASPFTPSGKGLFRTAAPTTPSPIQPPDSPSTLWSDSSSDDSELERAKNEITLDKERKRLKRKNRK